MGEKNNFIEKLKIKKLIFFFIIKEMSEILMKIESQ
jgi:hypothetical protein